MNNIKFWEIIDVACQSDQRLTDKWNQRLQTELQKLPPGEIIAWNQIFDQLAAKAYTVDLWGAAYLINGGASDDGFYYFRCWLIGMGQSIYDTALANPDSLADVAADGIFAEAEIYAAAHLAWMAVTGKTYRDPYPARNEETAIVGENWDFDDEAEARRRLPRLAVKFLGV